MNLLLYALIYMYNLLLRTDHKLLNGSVDNYFHEFIYI